MVYDQDVMAVSYYIITAAVRIILDDIRPRCLLMKMIIWHLINVFMKHIIIMSATSVMTINLGVYGCQLLHHNCCD